jgi:hypothetical protein
MAATDADLFAGLPTPVHTRGESVTIGHSWHGEFPGATFSIRTEHIGEARERTLLRIEAWVINPESLDAQHGEAAGTIRRMRHEAIAGWILGVAPPGDASVARKVESLQRSPHEWSSRDHVSGLEVRAWHSGGLKVASLEIPLDALEAPAEVATRALRVLVQEAAARRGAFGAAAVSL